MSETWVLWLTIIGILFLIVGIAIAIWASVSNNQYWYWGAIVAGVGVLLLLIAFILYVTGSETVPATTCQQPVVNSNPCCSAPQPQVQHVFYDGSQLPMNTQIPYYGSMAAPQVGQGYVQGPMVNPMYNPMYNPVTPTAPSITQFSSVPSQTISVPSLNSGQPLNLPNVVNPSISTAPIGTPFIQPINPGFSQSTKVVY